MSGCASVKDANSAVLRQISELIDEMLLLSQPDADLRMHCVKFQVEHAAAKAMFQTEGCGGASSGPTCALSAEMLHLQWALQRMIDFATSISQSIKLRSLRCFRDTSPSIRSSSPDSPYSDNSSVPRPGDALLGHFSESMDEFLSDHDARVELRANVMHAALEVLSQSLLVHPALCVSLQDYMINEKQLIPHLSELMCIEKDIERTCFTEGFKTDVMKLTANVTFENPSASTAVAMDQRFLNEILSATRIDDENPGLVEWAEFVIRNTCTASPAARDHLAKLQPSALHPQSSAFLGNPEYQFDTSGKLHLKKKR
jgi:ataxin-10